MIIRIWPVPPNHQSGFSHGKSISLKKVKLAALINAGFLSTGMALFPRRGKYIDKVATLISDGRVEVDGVACDSPSPAASKIVGHHTNGWGLF